MKRIFALLIAAIMLLALTACGDETTNAEEIVWSDIVMGEIIPTPPSNMGKLYSNSDEYLSVDIADVSEEQYKDYLAVCKETGFMVESNQTETRYEAYNADGYKLTLYFYNNELVVTLTAPMEMGQIVWSTSEYGKLLPIPTSTVGVIEKDDKTGLVAYLGQTTKDEYTAYINACIDKGFAVNRNEDDKSFTAQNVDGYKLRVEYKGNSVMYISVDEPEYDVEIEIKCRENLIFSRYDVKVYIDDSFEGTIKHGENDIYTKTLKRGVHTFRFVNAEDDEVDGSVTVTIQSVVKITIDIWCESSEVDISAVSGADVADDEKTTNIVLTMGADDFKGMSAQEAESKFREMGFSDIKFESVDTKDSALDKTVSYVSITEFLFGNSDFEKGDKISRDATIRIYEYKYKAPSPVSYSTNDIENAKKGDRGVFAYKSIGGIYDIYWIIDFDEGYVYWFTDGNGDGFCDRLKIESGNLNSVLIITYHEGGSTWSNGLHFKWKNQPDHLIMEDQNGFEYDYYPTNLNDALQIRNEKEIIDF